MKCRELRGISNSKDVKTRFRIKDQSPEIKETSFGVNPLAPLFTIVFVSGDKFCRKRARNEPRWDLDLRW